MAAPSITQETSESVRISFYVNKRTHSILSVMAKKREISVDRMLKEEAEHTALAHKSLVPLTMPPEHYEAREGEDIIYE